HRAVAAQFFDLRILDEPDAASRVVCLEELGHLRREELLPNTIVAQDHRDLYALLSQYCRDFHADESTADHDGSLDALSAFPNAFRIVQRTQIPDVRQLRPWDVQGAYASAGCHDQFVESEVAAWLSQQ